jgi:hypothetical protein
METRWKFSASHVLEPSLDCVYVACPDPFLPVTSGRRLIAGSYRMLRAHVIPTHFSSIFFSFAPEPKSGLGLLISKFRDFFFWTLGRTPLDEWSVRHKGLYLHRTTQHRNTQTNKNASSGSERCELHLLFILYRGACMFSATLCKLLVN